VGSGVGDRSPQALRACLDVDLHCIRAASRFSSIFKEEQKL
jgi:hypothetical protein